MPPNDKASDLARLLTAGATDEASCSSRRSSNRSASVKESSSRTSSHKRGAKKEDAAADSTEKRRSAVDLALDSIDDSDNDRYEEGGVLEEEEAPIKEEEKKPVKAVPKEESQAVALALVDMSTGHNNSASRLSRRDSALGAALDSIDESYNSNYGEDNEDDVDDNTDQKRRQKEMKELKESKSKEKEQSKQKSDADQGPQAQPLKIDLSAAIQMKMALKDMKKEGHLSSCSDIGRHRQSAVNIAVDSVDDDYQEKEQRSARRKTAGDVHMTKAAANVDCSRRSSRSTRSTKPDDAHAAPHRKSSRCTRSSSSIEDDHSSSNHHHGGGSSNRAKGISMDAAAAVARARACVEDLKPTNVATYRPSTEISTKMMAAAGGALHNIKVNARTGSLAEIRKKPERELEDDSSCPEETRTARPSCKSTMASRSSCALPANAAKRASRSAHPRTTGL